SYLSFYVTVLLAHIREDKGQKLEVSLLPKFPQVYIGDDVTLICNRKGGSKPTTWFIDDKQQSHQDYSMFLTAVTPINNGVYKCEQNGLKSDPLTLTVLELEPHAQLSPSVGGAVMTKGDGRNLVLQADDDLKNWSCFVLRGVNTSVIGLDVDEKMKRAVVYADLKEAERATFFCKKKKADLRSNAVTLKMTGDSLLVFLLYFRSPVYLLFELENAVFYKNKIKLPESSKGTYTITNATQDDNGKYSCRATYRFSHISAGAAQKEGDSDAQELKVIETYFLMKESELMTQRLTSQNESLISFNWPNKSLTKSVRMVTFMSQI
uniref:Ig-like domain-containing protein n=1 Tax=Cyprinus carpio TaxID=7962 RepID=A0A8C2IVG8_CYPCA